MVDDRRQQVKFVPAACTRHVAGRISCAASYTHTINTSNKQHIHMPRAHGHVAGRISCAASASCWALDPSCACACINMHTHKYRHRHAHADTHACDIYMSILSTRAQHPHTPAAAARRLRHMPVKDDPEPEIEQRLRSEQVHKETREVCLHEHLGSHGDAPVERRRAQALHRRAAVRRQALRQARRERRG